MIVIVTQQDYDDFNSVIESLKKHKIDLAHIIFEEFAGFILEWRKKKIANTLDIETSSDDFMLKLRDYNCFDSKELKELDDFAIILLAQHTLCGVRVQQTNFQCPLNS